ncbi:hypothetical protein ATER59S_01704 [Aquamicrobium terrae]
MTRDFHETCASTLAAHWTRPSGQSASAMIAAKGSFRLLLEQETYDSFQEGTLGSFHTYVVARTSCFLVPIMASRPPMKARIINTATSVPPRTAPAIEHTIRSAPGAFDLAPMATAPRTMVRNEKRIPPHPRPTTVFAPSASKPAATPPMKRVTIAAITAKIPATRPIIPPAFCILFSLSPERFRSNILLRLPKMTTGATIGNMRLASRGLSILDVTSFVRRTASGQGIRPV